VDPGVVTKSTAIEYCRDSAAELRTTPSNVQPADASPSHRTAATSGRALWVGEYAGTFTVVDDPGAVDDVDAAESESDESEHPTRTTAAATMTASATRRR
jgi:hypothetical protein